MYQHECDRDAFADGAHTLAGLVKPLLGQAGRSVMVAGATGVSSPESVSDGATVARRLTELDGRLRNAGAMHLRDLLLTVEREAGDGTTTTAVMFDAMLGEGRHAIAAGFDSALLRRNLLALLPAAREALRAQSRRLTGKASVANLAAGVCGESGVANAIAEAVSDLGPTCLIEIRHDRFGEGPLTRLNEPFWPTTRLGNTLFLDHHGLRLNLSTCAVLLSDLALERAEDALAIVRAAKAKGANSLLVIASAVSPACEGALTANRSPSFPIAATRTPGASADEHVIALQDLAVLTGARPLPRAQMDDLTRLTPADLGSCRLAWVSAAHLGIFGGSGDSIAIRKHIRRLRDERAQARDSPASSLLQDRLARLTNTGAIVWFDAPTERERGVRERLASRAARVTRDALQHGVVPGGGEALRRCAASLAVADGTADERVVARVLRAGLTAPAAQIAENGGGQLAGPCGEPPLDSTVVLDTALRVAVHGVAQALTIGTVVLRKTPERAAVS